LSTLFFFTSAKDWMGNQDEWSALYNKGSRPYSVTRSAPVFSIPSHWGNHPHSIYLSRWISMHPNPTSSDPVYGYGGGVNLPVVASQYPIYMFSISHSPGTLHSRVSHVTHLPFLYPLLSLLALCTEHIVFFISFFFPPPPLNLRNCTQTCNSNVTEPPMSQFPHAALLCKLV